MSEPQTDSGPSVGDYVAVSGERALVRWAGELPGKTGAWIGVEWDDAERGRHSGAFGDMQLFAVATEGGASFLRPRKVDARVSFLQALRDKFRVSSEWDGEGLADSCFCLSRRRVRGIRAGN